MEARVTVVSIVIIRHYGKVPLEDMKMLNTRMSDMTVHIASSNPCERITLRITSRHYMKEEHMVAHIVYSGPVKEAILEFIL